MGQTVVDSEIPPPGVLETLKVNKLPNLVLLFYPSDYHLLKSTTSMFMPGKVT